MVINFNFITVAIGLIFVTFVVAGATLVFEEVWKSLWGWFKRQSLYTNITSLDKVAKWILGIGVIGLVVSIVAFWIANVAPKLENNSKPETTQIQITTGKQDKVSLPAKVSNPNAEKLVQVYAETQSTKNQIAMKAADGKISVEEAEKLIKALDERNLTDEQLKLILQLNYNTSSN